MIVTAADNRAREQATDNLPSVQLALNGTPIYLRNLKATVKVVREEQDTSGQNSSTSSSDKGVKAKGLLITGKVPYRNAEWLKTLFQLAEASDKKGEQVQYRISNITAEAVNMRVGVFSGEVEAAQEDGQSWAVSFTLKEKDSVAEKTAKRKDKPNKTTKTDKKGKVAKGAGAKATGGSSKPTTKANEEAPQEQGSKPNSSVLADILGG
ncbi:hypothetical protein OF381_10560 [Mannheimia haemolytica]